MKSAEIFYKKVMLANACYLTCFDFLVPCVLWRDDLHFASLMVLQDGASTGQGEVVFRQRAHAEKVILAAISPCSELLIISAIGAQGPSGSPARRSSFEAGTSCATRPVVTEALALLLQALVGVPAQAAPSQPTM